MNEHQVRFEFNDTDSRELPLIVAQLPILPRHYWEPRDFSAPTLAAHPGSGPYRISEVDPGRRIVYQRDENYWGKDLPVNIGRYNIDRVIYEYYRDRDIAWEAFKAGLTDFRIDARAATWAIGYDFPAYRDGLIERITVPDVNPSMMQAFVFNLRKEKFQDPRVREALSLTFDFPWLNTNIFLQHLRPNRELLSKTPKWRRSACLPMRNWRYYSHTVMSFWRHIDQTGCLRRPYPSITRLNYANGCGWR